MIGRRRKNSNKIEFSISLKDGKWGHFEGVEMKGRSTFCIFGWSEEFINYERKEWKENLSLIR